MGFIGKSRMAMTWKVRQGSGMLTLIPESQSFWEQCRNLLITLCILHLKKGALIHVNGKTSAFLLLSFFPALY
jgi:hypothetical protein